MLRVPMIRCKWCILQFIASTIFGKPETVKVLLEYGANNR
ncbi:CRPV-187 [Crowpox virus]|nr:CRPV-187 [Crowpox virus]